MTLFLWHQTAFLAVTLAGLAVGRLPGLHTAPASAAWVAERLAWLPAFAVALAVLWTVFRRAERGPVASVQPARRPPEGRQPPASPSPRQRSGDHEASWMPHRGRVRHQQRVGRCHVDAVRIVEVTGGAAGDAAVTVLPDDPVGPRVDDDDAVVVVVVDQDVPVGKRQR
jgi:hypothetical protein